jgi:hypothetical protein
MGPKNRRYDSKPALYSLDVSARNRLPQATVGEMRDADPAKCEENSKRGRVCSQYYFFDANARVDHARKYGSKNQGSDSCCNEPTVGSSIHYFCSGYFKIIPLDFPSSWRRTDSVRLSMKRLIS